MDLPILIGLIIFLAAVAISLVFFIGSALNFDDAKRIDKPPSSKNYDYKENRNVST